MNILITSAGNFNASALIKELEVIDDVHVFVADEFEQIASKYLAHSFIKLPDPSEENYKNAVIDACRKHNIHIVLPSSEIDTIALAELKSKVDFKIAISNLELTETLNSRKPAEIYLSNHGFTTNADEDILQIMESGVLDIEHYISEFAIDFDGKASNVITRKIISIEESTIAVSEKYDNELIRDTVQKLVKLFQGQKGCGFFSVHLLELRDRLLVNRIQQHLSSTAHLGNVSGDNLCKWMISGSNPKNEKILPNGTRSFVYLKDRTIPTKVPGLKAIIFDLDETLFPQKPWILKKLSMLHDELKIEKVTKDKFVDTGLRLLEEGHRADLLDRLVELFKLPSDKMIPTYRNLVPDTREYPDVKPVLSELKSQGYLIGLLTDNPPLSQKQKLQSTGLENFFDAIHFTKESGFEKPDPQGFMQIRKKLNVEANECCMVGDHLYKDIIGGHNAGFAALCWLQRSGAMFNFDVTQFRKLHSEIQFHRFGDMVHLKSFLDKN